MKPSRFTLSVLAMFAVVAVVTLISLLSDSPSASRYSSELGSTDVTLPVEAAVETTDDALSDPAPRDTEAALAPLDDSVRSRQQRAAESGSANAEDDVNDAPLPGTDPDSGEQSPEDPTPVPEITLTLEERKAFYWEIIEAQDRAVLEANAEYPMDADPPDVDSYIALWLELSEEYEGAVRAKYGLIPAQADIVIEEGIVNNWPMPPLPT